MQTADCTHEIRAAGPDDAALLAELIRASHRDVAERFGLTAANCPKHPSQCRLDWILADFARGERYFLLFTGGTPAGCVAYERTKGGLAYLNRLSVLPAHRRRGYGSLLVRFILETARREGVERIFIGTIGEHTALQHWYEKQGFLLGEVKRFPHLPFSVRYMSRATGGV